MIFSPYGVASLLTMLTVGAQGETRAQLTTVLDLPDSPASYLEAYEAVTSELSLDNLTRAANIFIDSFYWIDQQYKERIERYFHTEYKTTSTT